ncbi:hypothetical protein ACFT1A_24820 [Rhodococcus sp. NPDC057135]|uniref:hypothetical protein n=1 Tax=Rhodococcus sp. NPDC057135 TaxID=3346028 RepID=UPI003634D912
MNNRKRVNRTYQHSVARNRYDDLPTGEVSSFQGINRTGTTKAGANSFQVLFRFEGKQTSDVFGTYDEAFRYRLLVEKAGAKTAREMTLGDTAVAAELSVAEWITTDIDHLTAIEEATHNQYRRYLRRDIEPILGPLPLSAVNETALSVWVQSLTEAGKTIANKHGFLSGRSLVLSGGSTSRGNPVRGDASQVGIATVRLSFWPHPSSRSYGTRCLSIGACSQCSW